jgi:microsomal dipeptidase-like Zn-dependent dipeptidase
MRYNGLSDLGREAVRELNRWGIMIDLSHPSKAATLEMIKLSRAPVIASHSSARALNDVPRNMDDEQLMALKANGGVVQAVAFRGYLNSDKDASWQAEVDALTRKIGKDMGIDVVTDRRQIFAMQPQDRTAYFKRIQPLRKAVRARLDEIDAPSVDVSDFVDHIDYLVEKVGIDHVGISSDFDGGGGVAGWESAADTFNVTLELVKRGYSESDIDRIWSGNLLRVMGQVQAIGKMIRAEDAQASTSPYFSRPGTIGSPVAKSSQTMAPNTLMPAATTNAAE